MSENKEKDIDSYISDAQSRFVSGFLGVIGSSVRATIRFFRYIPWRIRNYFKLKYNEYKNRPPRKDLRKVYVLVGYTTKESVNAKYNAERHLIIIRRGLLAIILLLLIFISIDRLLGAADFGEISHVFGIESIDDITENDPFKVEGQYIETSETSETSVTMSMPTDFTSLPG